MTYTSAHLSGEIDPGNEDAYYYFEYSTEAGGGYHFDSYASLAASSGPTEVSTDLQNLQPGTEYFVRLVIENSSETQRVYSSEPNPTFTTTAIPNDPVPAATAATEVAYTTTHLNGTIDPEESPVAINYRFEYSKAGEEAWIPTGYGQLSAEEAEGNAPIALSGADLTQLAPGTEYEFRLVASNGNEFTSAGPNPTFTTGAVDLPAVTIDPVTSFDGHGAELSGEVEVPGTADPAFDATWRFECSSDCRGELSGHITAASSPQSVQVEATTTGLEPNTVYEVRLVASNDGGQDEDQTTFTTEALPDRRNPATCGDRRRLRLDRRQSQPAKLSDLLLHRARRQPGLYWL